MIANTKDILRKAKFHTYDHGHLKQYALTLFVFIAAFVMYAKLVRKTRQKIVGENN